MRWTGERPKTGLPAAARTARYRLLAQAARASGATHILTAHTRDDQAETLLMRLLRGSGIGGLAAMARESERDGVRLARPFLQVSKSQLVATLKKAKIGFADDPTATRVLPGLVCARSCRFLPRKAAMRAIWRGWRRGLPGLTRLWKFWSTAPSAISR
jgi:tRNA(Ile)-lysidine synthase